jgi:hypothetical protein
MVPFVPMDDKSQVIPMSPLLRAGNTVPFTSKQDGASVKYLLAIVWTNET